MARASVSVRESEHIFTVRDFNRFYTARLGLLQKRYLNGEFSLTESRILYEIGANPQITASTLRVTLRLDAGYISRLLASLTRRRFVRQSVSDIDSRERLLSLTATGDKKVAALNHQSAAQIEDLLHGLTERDRTDLVQSLGRIRSLLAAPVQEDSASATSSNPTLRVIRLARVTREALDLLEEYYESVGVVLRDTPATVRQVVRDPNGGVWLAYLDGKPVGCAYLRSLPSIPSATECKRMYVRPAARGKGVAHALLNAQEEFARARGLRHISLDSKDDLKVAINMYARRGFTPCARYNNNPQATVFMVKHL
jgi:DNA-binding MarR family transcriptional regulator/GNAT superfamily N-acetyltransferase